MSKMYNTQITSHYSNPLLFYIMYDIKLTVSINKNNQKIGKK